MSKEIKVTDSIRYIGVNDYDLDLFESQYIVPNGMAYNSYLILDDKTAIMDTVDARKTDEWMIKLESELGDRKPDYLIVQHLEPDHSGSIEAVAEKYPDMTIVTSTKSAGMFGQFTDKDYSGRIQPVGEGDKLELGSHTLNFVMAPMVHWPEVMVTYESSEKILFAADAFGKFGTLDTDEDWACEARRYYFNIVGKYGAQAQALLKKAAALDIEKICSLHGPILPDQEELSYYIDKYQTWSTYQAEDDGVFVAYTSIHGNTGAAAKKLGEILEKKGAKKVVVTDLAREDIAEAVEDAFRYDKLVVASATYDGGLFPTMENFLYRLGHKNFQNKKVAFMENGSWAPVAAKKMREKFESMKNITLCDNVVTIKSKMKESDVASMEALADEILG
ncbi:MAG: FprA family A-type flavoprotein [Eubacterium sp.]|nr:FprA family A-type flavoprotein [Eubacterium sp.]